MDTMGQEMKQRRPADRWHPNLGPLGYVWDQLPASFRAQWRNYIIGRESPHCLPCEFVVGFEGIGAVIGVPGEETPSKRCLRTHIERRGLPVSRPLCGCGYVGNGKLVSPLCHLLRWSELQLNREWPFRWHPATREEVE